MCGRFFRHRSASEIERAFKAELSPGVDAHPRYNIPPSAQVLAVRRNPQTEQRTLDALHWGLLPHFAKERRFAFKCSNARSETVDSKPTYRAAFSKRRCIVPLDGFFEWGQTADRKKHPYAIAMRDQRLFGVAGIWENWQDPEAGEWVRSVALLTTAANGLVARIHDRMPVILKEADYATWLGEEPAAPSDLKALLRPYAAADMIMWPVDARMNRPHADDVTVLDELPQDPLGLHA
jgi:putative SOS response-associated peptidase YedK